MEGWTREYRRGRIRRGGVCRERCGGEGRKGGSRNSNQLPESSRFPMTSFHPILASRTASPVNFHRYPTHFFFLAQTHIARHANTHTPPVITGGSPPRLDSGDEVIVRLKQRAPHTGWTSTHFLTHTHSLTHTVLQRDYPVIKSLKPQYDWSPPN